MHCTAGSRYARWVTASRVRQLGQALTALSAVIIAYATLTTTASPPPTDTDDQVLHFLLFLPLGVGGAMWMAMLPPDRQRRARALILAIILAFAAATELIQGVMETRDGSFADFVADAAGAGLGVVIGGFVASRARRDE